MRARWFAAGVVVGVAAAGLGGIARAADVDMAYSRLRVFSQVFSYIENNYVDDIDSQVLVHDAVNGMLTHLDPHSAFLPKEAFEKLREDTAGAFGGLGLVVGVVGAGVDAGLVVEQVDKDGPGAHAGLKVGDRVIAVDGFEAVGDDAVDVAIRRMRGVPGTRVGLTVTRTSWVKPRDVPLVRRQVRTRSVEHAVLSAEGAPVIGYIAISTFSERTDDELGAALTAVRRAAIERGLAQPSGLVLDLRNNPGGLLDEGVKVADRFLRAGLIVSTEGRNPRHVDRESAHDDGTEPDYPIAIVVNGGTASASEIVAAALQDHKRASIVGERSFGKGSVQTLFGLDDGAGLKLTIARYFTPSGRSIQGLGIQPDVVVRGVNSPGGPKAHADDPQIAAALAVLTRRQR
jgi:carboxyl-terminal processing protease